MTKIAFLSAEFRPLAKIGGLADVAEELPRALLRLGLDVRLFMPCYSHINLPELGAEAVAEIPVQRGDQTVQAVFYSANVYDIPTYFVDGPALQQAPEVYPGQPLEGERFLFFAIAVVNYFNQSGWVPDVMHANDWHTAASVPYLSALKEQQKGVEGWELQKTGTLLTIHNLPYMGVGSEPAVRAYRIPRVECDFLPDWAREIPLPMGISLADRINTVSPSYAKEIQTKEYGSGLDGLLSSRSDALSGILNGIDPASWDPAADTDLVVNFSRDHLEERVKGKQALLEETGLEPDVTIPLLGMVTRLDIQKGVDITLDALESMLEANDQPVSWKFILLGTGDFHLESRCADFSARYPDRIKAVLKYDAGLASRIYAGSDMILVPSRYEPCGLAQLIAMRYGAIPVVRATGGLKDSVPPYSSDGSGIGFLFEDLTADAFRDTLYRALDAYGDQGLWKSLQLRAMAADYSWKRSAEQYRDLYLRIVADRASS
ncbi:MAG: glycogen synthase [Anaerolineales bacterium]|nr:glycogen synthase [Anaerolineales bacterium]